MGYIYKITNDINGKVYIGLTDLENPTDRWTKHLSEFISARKYTKRPLYDAMYKYGFEHFHFEVIEETNNLEERERYWINYYRSYIGFEDCNGYNATLGGEGSKKLYFTPEEEQFIIESFESGMSCTKISKIVHHTVDNISSFLREKGYVVKINRATKVGQYDLAGNFICEYESAAAAAKALDKKGNGSHISEVCNGKRKSSYGYLWKYI